MNHLMMKSIKIEFLFLVTLVVLGVGSAQAKEDACGNLSGTGSQTLQEGGAHTGIEGDAAACCMRVSGSFVNGEGEIGVVLKDAAFSTVLESTAFRDGAGIVQEAAFSVDCSKEYGLVWEVKSHKDSTYRLKIVTTNNNGNVTRTRTLKDGYDYGVFNFKP